MGRKLNLSHLTEEECEQILKVIQKDFDLRQVEKERLACIEAKVQEEDARIKILAKREDFNEKYCLICFKKFLFFFIPKTRCAFCKYYLCKSCISFDSQLKADICLVCHKYHEYLLQSNSWFYKNIGNKFKRFGSAKVVRSLYKRKTDSDAESDSGYHPSIRENVSLSESVAKHLRPNLSKVFELDEMKDNGVTDKDDPVQTLSHYRHKLEAIERQIRKQFIESKGGQKSGRSSGSSDELMKQQAFNVSLLLSSMTNELTSHLTETADKRNPSQFPETELEDNATKEAISKCVLEQCINHICQSSLPATASEDDHPFGIDPDDQTLRSYIERLSTAIVTKMNVDMQSSEEKIFQEEEEEVRKELLKLSNRARMSQIGKQLSDSELEDLPVTTDSMSDVDVREWQIRNQTESLSTSSSLRREPVDHINFDESEYDVDENSIFAFASRKKGLVTLPGLDTSSPAKSVDVDLEFTAGTGSSSGDPWTLAERGPVVMMSNRIPIAPYDNYGEKKCGPAEVQGDLKMYLPTRPSVEGPMIDSMSVYELADLSEGSLGSPFDQVQLHYEVSVMEELPLSQSNFPSGPMEQLEVSADGTPEEDMEVLTDGTLLKHSKIPEYEKRGTPEKHADFPAENDEFPSEPRFVTLPEDVAVNCGDDFMCSCELDGAKPIDVFWYRDADELIQLGSDERFTVTHKGSVYKIHLSNCQSFDGGLYLCIAVNQHGSCQHRFSVKVQDEKTSKESLLDSGTTGNVSFQKKYGHDRVTNKHPGGLTAYATRKELLSMTSTGIQSHHADCQEINNKSACMENSTGTHKESSANSHTADGDKAPVSAMALDVSISADNKMATATNSIVTEEETNEYHFLASSQKKLTEYGGIMAPSARSQHDTTADENTIMVRDDTTNTHLLLKGQPDDTKVRNASSRDSKVTGVIRVAESNTNEGDVSCTDHQKSNEDKIKTADLDKIPENDNRRPTKENAEHQLSYRDCKSSNRDDIRTSSGMALSRTTESVDKDEKSIMQHHLTNRNHDKLDEPKFRTLYGRFSDESVDKEEKSITEHHLTYKYQDKPIEPNTTTFYGRFLDASVGKEEKSLVNDEIGQHPTSRDHKISVEAEIRTATDTRNKNTASEEKTLIKPNKWEYPTSGGFHEVPDKYDDLPSAKNLTSHLTSVDRETKENAAMSESDWKIISNDTITSEEVQTPMTVDCRPQNDYTRYSRDFDISQRRQLFEQKSVKSASMERRISASLSHLPRHNQHLSSESDVFEPEERSFVNATNINLRSAPEETAQAPKKNDLEEITLPSVKLLRLKFSTPPETSAETILQRKRHSETKLEAEPRWKSAEHAEKQFASFHVPVSVIPLQPAPINSRNNPRPASRSDNAEITSYLKSEPKFQQHVIIRPQVIKYNQSDSEETQPEPDEYLLPQSTAVAERVVIRPFSQRGSPSAINEARKKASSDQNR